MGGIGWKCKGGKVSEFEWLVEVVVGYGIHWKVGHLSKEVLVGQKEVVCGLFLNSI